MAKCWLGFPWSLCVAQLVQGPEVKSCPSWQGSAEFCVLRVVHKPKAWSWESHQASQSQAASPSPSLPRGNEPAGAQSSSLEKGTHRRAQALCRGSLRTLRLHSLRDSGRSANRALGDEPRADQKIARFPLFPHSCGNPNEQINCGVT